MTEISLILFDLNGVLYCYERAARIAQLSALSHQSAEAIETAIWDSGFEDAGDAGTLDAVAYLSGFGASIGYDLQEAEWLDALRQSLTPIDATLALLGRLRPQARCAVLTNNNLLVRRHLPTLYPEIAGIVGRHAYVSAEFGLRKPDPEVYRRCVRHCCGDPPATLFVDDNAANVAGARAAGLEGCDRTEPDALEAMLLDYGLLR